MKNDDIRTVHFRVARPKEVTVLKKAIVSSLHFQNLLILLVREAYELSQSRKIQNFQKYLLDKRIMRAVVSGSLGGKNKEIVSLLLKHYKDNAQFQDLLKVAKTLKEKNIAQLVGKVKAAYKSYFTKKKNGDEKAKPPAPQKLRKVNNFAIPIDQCSFSLSKKGFLRINLDKKMKSYHLDHEKLSRIVGNLKNIQSLEILLKHDEIYFSISYHSELKKLEKATSIVSAGLDLGVRNTASIFIADSKTPSLIISGKELIYFNTRNNIQIARRKSLEKNLENKLIRTRKNLENGTLLSEKDLLKNADYASIKAEWYAAKNKLSKTYKIRHRKYKDIFHKLSVRLLEFLSQVGVNLLFVSRNLGEAKQAKGFKRKFNRDFHQIPLLKLIDYLQLKGGEYGIQVENIDEAYTSKSSCLSGNVNDAQKIAAELKQEDKNISRKERRQRFSNALMGVRESRSMFCDRVLGKRILADLNAACNHIKVGLETSDFSWLQGKLWKLTRPVLVNTDSLLLDLTLTGVWSELGDPLRDSYAAKLRKNLFR